MTRKVGLVKNLSLMTNVTVETDPFLVHQVVLDFGVIPLSTISSPQVLRDRRLCKVFVNGNWVGVTEKPERLVEVLRNFRRSVKSNRTIGIYLDQIHKEVKVSMDAGRTSRPLLTVEDNALVLEPEDLQLSWDELVSIALERFDR